MSFGWGRPLFRDDFSNKRYAGVFPTIILEISERGE